MEKIPAGPEETDLASESLLNHATVDKSFDT